MKKKNVPFIGWNKITKKKNCPILDGLSDNDFFIIPRYYVEMRIKMLFPLQLTIKILLLFKHVSKNSILQHNFTLKKVEFLGLKYIKIL